MALKTNKGKDLVPGRDYLVTVAVTLQDDGAVAVYLANGEQSGRSFDTAEVEAVATSIKKA